MKTKYVKVPVSERLPEKSGLYFIIKPNSHFDKLKATYFSVNTEDFGDGKDNEAEYFLEEVPDHSEEMLSILQRILDLNILPGEIDDEAISLTLKVQGYDMNQIDKISQNGFENTKQLINKVKDNG